MATVDKDGWLHTGDIVSIDHDGYIFVKERLKEIIKYKGFQVSLDYVPSNLHHLLLFRLV